MDLPTLASVLQLALSTNPEERKAGEERLNQVRRFDFVYHALFFPCFL